ncbi:MAG: hypothetical protein KBT20_03105 [Bacteroidales bacterium]|nr:hypothetical protein [Candidatus Liminaster caballi]
MSIFTVEKPRRFQRENRFSNERKEYLEARRRIILHEEGILPTEELKAEEIIRGKFIEGTTHLRRRKEREEEEGTRDKSKRWVKMGVWLIVMVVLFVWLFRSIYNI